MSMLFVLRIDACKNSNTEALDSKVSKWKYSRTLNVAAVLGAVGVAGYHRARSSCVVVCCANSQSQ
jgi:hypothetical protein